MELIRDLLSRGFGTGEDTVTGILEGGGDSFWHLAEIATDGRYWRDPDPDTEPSICAIHLLAELGDRRSLLAIISALVEYHRDMEDWLTAEMPYMLAHMGPATVPTLTLVMRERSVYQSVRSGMARALVMIAGTHPDTRPGIVESIKGAVCDEPDIDMRTAFVNSMMGVKDPSTYGYMRDCLQAGLITDDYFKLEELDDMYEKWALTEDTTPRDPLMVFEYHPMHASMIRRYWGPGAAPPDSQTGAAQDVAAAAGDGQAPGGDVPGTPPRPGAGPPRAKPGKVGRNEPCPCGSGKKYKRCCMRRA